MKKVLLFIAGGILTLLAFFEVLPIWLRIIFAGAVYIYFGLEVFTHLVEEIKNKDFFTENFLMGFATLGAIFIGEFADAAAVMLLYSLGEHLSDVAYSNSRESIEALLEIAPEYANILKDGKIIRVLPEEVKAGDTIVIKSGERIPLDGEITGGNGVIDYASITGEGLPVNITEGERCISGGIVVDGTLSARVESEYENSVAARMVRAIKEASNKKAKNEKFITKFSRIYTPAAVLFAVGVFILSSIITRNVTYSFKTALVILVISCPCALVLSVPLTYFSAIGAGSRHGILFKGGEAIDSVSEMRTIVFDKTGTITKGKASVEGVYPDGVDEKEFTDIAFSVMQHSAHPLSVAFCKEKSPEQIYDVEDMSEYAGRGIAGKIGGKDVIFGNAALLKEHGIEFAEAEGTLTYGAYDGKYIGYIRYSDNKKDGVDGFIGELKELGVRRIAIMSGDKPENVKAVAENIGIDEYYGGLLPDEKLEKFERIYTEEKEKDYKATVSFCGDGLNDSAVIARSDAGIAMGDSGIATAIESADTVIMDGDITKLVKGIKIARQTKKIAIQNIVFSLGIKALIMAIGIFLIPSMELAVIADVGVTILAVLNSVRVGLLIEK